jgi:signal transduction histidine kinase
VIIQPEQEDTLKPPPRSPFDRPELENAIRGGIVITEHNDENGQSMLFTVAPIHNIPQPPTFIQLSVPTKNLQDIVLKRWIVLWLIFAFVTTLALLVTILISRSITRPLITLRESAIQLSQGDFSHRITYTGVDEIGEVAKAFNEMARQVENMLEEQRAFASNTAHELRTPLTTIRLRSEALRHDTQLDEAIAKQYIAEIDDEVTRLGSLIEDLTLLSRFDAGRAELGQGQLDLRRFAINMEKQMRPQATAKKIQLNLSVPNNPIIVNASLSHLTVVFRNLLDNAIKYTPNGGKITWHISECVDGICSIIEDNGRGVDPEYLPNLFERFYRADKSRSRNIPGTGLGLALTKSIIEAYGGLITIESIGKDEGTTATVLWPSSQSNGASTSLHSDE